MRISIEVTPEQHRHIKTMAAYNGLTIKDLLIASVTKYVGKQDETEYLLSSKANRENLEKSLKWLDDYNSGKTSDAVKFSNFEEFKNEYNL